MCVNWEHGLVNVRHILFGQKNEQGVQRICCKTVVWSYLSNQLRFRRFSTPLYFDPWALVTSSTQSAAERDAISLFGAPSTQEISKLNRIGRVQRSVRDAERVIYWLGRL
jgi:hypothetical protein